MSTKKTFFTIVIALLSIIISIPANGQIKIGAKAGVELGNTSSLNDILDVENLTSYHVGPAIELMFPFSKVNFGLEAALLYSDNRMKVKNLMEGGGTSEVSNRYLMLPVNAKLKLPLGSNAFKLYAVGGPYAGYLISGDKLDLPQMSEDIKAKDFEAGINLGLGFELFKMVQLGANYKLRVTDNYSASKDEWKDPFNKHPGVWSVELGVYF